MIVSKLIPKQGICSLIVESPDDLWTLRRLISPGDTVVTKSSRVVKSEDEYLPARQRRAGEGHHRPGWSMKSPSTAASAVSGYAGESPRPATRASAHAGTHSVSVTPGYGLTLKKQRVDARPHQHPELDQGRRWTIPAGRDGQEGSRRWASSADPTLPFSRPSIPGPRERAVKEVDTEPFLRKIVEVLRNSWREG